MPSHETSELARLKLESSGLQALSLQSMNVDVLDGAETAAISAAFPSVPCMKIRYMDPHWKTPEGQPLRHLPRWDNFFRIRLLGEVKDSKGKVVRYLQPKGAGVCAYFPSIVNWKPVLEDTDFPIVITEGEFKAIRGCQMGFPTIGLGGVANIYSRATGVGFLPELEKINWIQRKVYITFDNDGKPKPDVLLSANMLAKELEERGAMVYLVHLPEPVGGQKMGLDDFFLSHDAQDFQRLLDAAESMTMAKPLWDFNERFVKICSPSLIVDKLTLKQHPVKVWLEHYSNRTVPEQLLLASGEMSYKPKVISTKWLAWPQRMSLDGMDYMPGASRYEDGKFNLWAGWGVEPVKGNVQPFLELIDQMFGTTPKGKAAAKWFLRWLAYPIQYPGAKLYSAVLLWSAEQGTGKTFIGYMMGRIYGEANYQEVSQKDLHGDFNSWVKCHQFVLGDEITGSDKKEVADNIKRLVTNHTIRVNEKYIPEYNLRNVANFFLTSNRPSALFIEDHDRRYFVWEVLRKADPELFRRLDHWVWSDDAGMAALHYYLRNLDLGDFDPKAPPPDTDAKRDMIAANRPSHSKWCHDLRESPDHVLRIGRAPIEDELFTSKELLRLFRLEDPASTIKEGMFGSELKAAGFHQLDQLRWGDPSQRSRFFVIRNEAHWKKATTTQIKNYINRVKAGKSV